MELVKIKCPNCDASIEVDKEGTCKCPYCGTTFFAERVDDNVIINTTINNYSGGSPSRYRTPVSDKKQKLSGVILTLVVIGIISAAIITFLILALLIKGMASSHDAYQDTYQDEEQEEAQQEYIYRDAVESDYMKSLVKYMFGKEATDVTAEDYGRVKELHFNHIGSSSNDWRMDYMLDDGIMHTYVTAAELYYNNDFSIPWEDIQPFTGLEVLDCDGCSDFSAINNNIYSDELPKNLANLTQLREFRAPEYYDAADLKGFFADDTLKVLSVPVNKYAPERLIVENEPQIEELYLDGYSDDMNALSELSNLKKIQVDYTGQDMGFLNLLDKLESLQIECDDTAKDFSFLYGLTNLKSLSITKATGLKEIGFIDNMSELDTLCIGESAVMNLDKLTDRTGITNLTIIDNDEISDYSFLTSLTGLTDLHLDMDLWAKEVTMPDLSGLPNLTTVTIPTHIEEAVSGSATVKSLYLYTGSSMDDINDLRNLNNLPALEYLYIGCNGATEYIEHTDSLAQLTALKVLVIDRQRTFGFDTEEDFADILNLPYLEELYMYIDSTNTYSIDPNRVKDNDHLKILYLAPTDVTAISGGHRDFAVDHSFGEYTDMFRHFTAIEELSITKAHISDLSFVESLPELRKLNITDNYVQDVSPLTNCTHLTYVSVIGNPVQNVDVLPDTVVVIK